MQLNSYLCPRVRLRLRESHTSLTSLPILINIFRFAGWAVFLILKQIEPINNLLILSFSVSNHFGCQEKEIGFQLIFGSKYVIKCVHAPPKIRL